MKISEQETIQNWDVALGQLRTDAEVFSFNGKPQASAIQ